MIFTFTKIPAKDPFTKRDSSCYRPMVPIDIGFQGNWLSSMAGFPMIDALIDTGADWSMAPSWMATSLHIPSHLMSDGETLGIGNQGLKTSYAKAQIKVAGHTIDTCIGFCDTVQFPLIGRENFLNRFMLKLDYPSKFELVARGPAT